MTRFVVIRDDDDRSIGEVQADGSVEQIIRVQRTSHGSGFTRAGIEVLDDRTVELARLLNLGNDLSGIDLASVLNAGPGSG